MTNKKLIIWGGVIAAMSCMAIILFLVSENLSQASTIKLSAPVDGTPIPDGVSSATPTALVSSLPSSTASVAPTATSSATTTATPTTRPSSTVSANPSAGASVAPSHSPSAGPSSAVSSNPSAGVTTSPTVSTSTSAPISTPQPKTTEQVVLSTLKLQAEPVVATSDHRYNIVIQCTVPTGVSFVTFLVNSDNPMTIPATLNNNTATATITSPLESGKHQITVAFKDPTSNQVMEIKRDFFVSPVLAASTLNGSSAVTSHFTDFIPLKYIFTLIAMILITTVATFVIYRKAAVIETKKTK
ncbi:MAG: hypothetical protein WC773_01175 [Patescibacteria group bacterium]|jgi:hypothetical protein